MVVQRTMGLDPATAALAASAGAGIVDWFFGGDDEEARLAALRAQAEIERQKKQRTIIWAALGATGLVAAVLIFRR